jgi:hypothetical protein
MGCSRVLAPCVDEPVIGHLLRSWVTIDPVDLLGPNLPRARGRCFSIPDRFRRRASSRTPAPSATVDPTREVLSLVLEGIGGIEVEELVGCLGSAPTSMAGITVVQARASCPPSTEITAPVTNAASSEHSHAAVAATSLGIPIRCIGIAWAIGARCSSGSAPMRSVMIEPAAIALMRNPDVLRGGDSRDGCARGRRPHQGPVGNGWLL